MAELDSLGRRSRTRPQPTGKKITLQPADLLWLRKLAEHGPLSSSFLLAYTKPLRRSDKRSLERLTDLFNEDRTGNGGAYLTRPPQQFRTIDSRYNQLVYDLTPAGRDALQETGVRCGLSNRSGPWLHRHMVAATTASVELATLTRPDLSYISQWQILDRADTEPAFPVSFKDPATGRSVERKLIPDALFGLAYHGPDGERFRFFAVECDRATEPLTSSTWNRKSWRRHLHQYAAYVEAGAYRRHLKLTAPLLVLNVTTNEARCNTLMAATAREKGATPYQLFQAWTAFGTIWRPPSPNQELLTGAWLRAGCEGFGIGER